MKRVTKLWLLGGVSLLGMIMPWQVEANDSSVGESVATVERARTMDRAAKTGESNAEKQPEKQPDKAAEKTTENYIDKMFDGGPSNDRLTKMHAAHDDLLGALRSDGHYSQFVQLAEASGFDKTLHGRGPFTVFAPTDEAFAKLPSELRDGLSKEPSRLKGLLAYHVIRGLVSKDVLNHLRNIKTMSGSVVNVDYTSGIRINHAHLTSGDHYGSNGMFHAIDELLSLPERPTATAKPEPSQRKKSLHKPAPTT